MKNSSPLLNLKRPPSKHPFDNEASSAAAGLLLQFKTALSVQKPAPKPKKRKIENILKDAVDALTEEILA